MRFVDIHPHVISSDRTRYPRVPLGGKSSKWSEEHTVSYDEMIAAMDDAGVAKSMLVQAATCYGYDNSYVADAVAAHPNRLSGIFTIDALAGNAPESMTYWVSRGLSGIRLFTTGSTMPEQATWFAESRADPFWEKAAELALPVCLQMSWIAIPQLRSVLKRFSGVRIVLDHLSRPPIDDGPPYRKAAAFFALAEHSNLYLKVTPVNVFAMDRPPASAETFMRHLVDVFGAGRIAWGSNYPSSTATLREALHLNWRASASLTEAERAKIFSETAQSLYPSLCEAAS